MAPPQAVVPLSPHPIDAVVQRGARREPGERSDQSPLARRHAVRLLSGLGSARPTQGHQSGANPQSCLSILKESGQVDVVDINSNPVARVMMDSLVTAGQIEHQIGIPTIPHVTTREMNIMGLQSLMLGAWGALKMRNILVVTGDPPRIGEYPEAKGYTKSTPSAW